MSTGKYMRDRCAGEDAPRSRRRSPWVAAARCSASTPPCARRGPQLGATWRRSPRGLGGRRSGESRRRRRRRATVRRPRAGRPSSRACDRAGRGTLATVRARQSAESGRSPTRVPWVGLATSRHALHAAQRGKARHTLSFWGNEAIRCSSASILSSCVRSEASNRTGEVASRRQAVGRHFTVIA